MSTPRNLQYIVDALTRQREAALDQCALQDAEIRALKDRIAELEKNQKKPRKANPPAAPAAAPGAADSALGTQS